ncbi:hypothetical protein BMF94_3702 [Rhodotorula taiwanensis]|uniref:Uncharacterized protein n=1 Tax=Rhodotorula taiwanensis TaxID=741276 RepID=A0A2S5B9B3_9BASI|nr:hypothetical protein BMF94_3702 [Rhodotorula taiwanensis]
MSSDSVPPRPPPRHPSAASQTSRRPSSVRSGAELDSALANSSDTAQEARADNESTVYDDDAKLAEALAQLEAEQAGTARRTESAARLSATQRVVPDTSSSIPPPRHPASAARAHVVTPPRSPPLDEPLEPPPIRTAAAAAGRGSDSPTLDRQLQDLQDIEIARLLERVGHRLTDVRIAEATDARFQVEYPTKDAFRRPPSPGKERGSVDWSAYSVVYLACLATDYIPASLVDSGPLPRQDFSLRELRSELERTYVLCPPPVWQRIVLTEIAALWQWDAPSKTGGCLAGYLFLWYFDLFFLAPCIALTALLVKVRFFPPSKAELVQTAQDRQARSRDAKALSKQLRSSSVFGYAGQGVKGLWTNWRERVKDLGPVGAVASALGPDEDEDDGEGSDSDDLERADPSARSAQIPAATPAPVQPNSAIGQLVASTNAVSASAAAPATVEVLASTSKPPPEIEDPARAPGGKEGDGDVSLYRLMRSLMAAYGPNVVLWLGEINDAAERIKKYVHLPPSLTRILPGRVTHAHLRLASLIDHPEHPAVRIIALRLAVASIALCFTPISLVYKAAWLYLGLDFFVMWKVRAMYPEWRGATMPHRWLLLGAPNDVQYALYALRQRQLEGKPIHGARTLKRRARAANSSASGDLADGNSDLASASTSATAPAGKLDKTKARARAVSNAVSTVLDEAERYRSRKSSDFDATDRASAVGIPLGKPDASYFALYSSKPGSLCLHQDRLCFVPARHLTTVSRITNLFGSGVPRRAKHGYSDDEDEADDADTATIGSTSSKRTIRSTLSDVLAEGGEIAVLYEEIEGVTKQTKMKAFEALVVKTKDGRTFTFRNVSRRDEAFTKLLSFTAAKWKQR